MTNAYPMEFRRDVVQVALNREPGVTPEKIVADFGIHPITLSTWLKRADIENGVKPGTTSTQSAELREANKRIRLLEQEAEALSCHPNSIATFGVFPVLGRSVSPGTSAHTALVVDRGPSQCRFGEHRGERRKEKPLLPSRADRI